MTEDQLGQEEERAPAPARMDRKTLAMVLAFGLVLVLLIAFNMN